MIRLDQAAENTPLGAVEKVYGMMALDFIAEVQDASEVCYAAEFAMMGISPKDFKINFGVDEVFDLSPHSVFYHHTHDKSSDSATHASCDSSLEYPDPQDIPHADDSRLCQSPDAERPQIPLLLASPLRILFLLCSRNSSASVPAASRNRPAVNPADRPHPAGWTKNTSKTVLLRPVSSKGKTSVQTSAGDPSQIMPKNCATTPYEATKTNLKDETVHQFNVHLYRFHGVGFTYVSPHATRPDIKICSIVLAPASSYSTDFPSECSPRKSSVLIGKGNPLQMDVNFWQKLLCSGSLESEPVAVLMFSTSLNNPKSSSTTKHKWHYKGIRYDQDICVSGGPYWDGRNPLSCIEEGYKPKGRLVVAITSILQLASLYLIPADSWFLHGCTYDSAVSYLSCWTIGSAGCTRISLVVIIPAGTIGSYLFPLDYWFCKVVLWFCLKIIFYMVSCCGCLHSAATSHLISADNIQSVVDTMYLLHQRRTASARWSSSYSADDLAQADVPLVSEQHVQILHWCTLLCLGADVNERQLIERMTAITERKKRALAELPMRSYSRNVRKKDHIIDFSAAYRLTTTTFLMILILAGGSSFRSCWFTPPMSVLLFHDTAGAPLDTNVHTASTVPTSAAMDSAASRHELGISPFADSDNSSSPSPVSTDHIPIDVLFDSTSGEDEVLAEILFRGQYVSGAGVVVVDKLPDDEIVDPRVKVEPITDSASSPPRSRSKHRGVRMIPSPLWDRPLTTSSALRDNRRHKNFFYLKELLPHVYREDLLLLRRRMNRYFRLNPDVDVGLDLWRDVNLLCPVPSYLMNVEDFWRTQDEWVVSGWRLYPKSSVHTLQDGLRESYECLASAPILVLYNFGVSSLALHYKWISTHTDRLTAEKEFGSPLQTALVCNSNPLIALWASYSLLQLSSCMLITLYTVAAYLVSLLQFAPQFSICPQEDLTRKLGINGVNTKV
ncbi:hypothetical protein Tco_0014316 [Tanacetum coccineum]